MRTTLNLDDDALMAARHWASRHGLSLGEAASALIRRGLQAQPTADGERPPRGRFALLGARDDEVITPDHVRLLMEREGI